jgi:hypothetical protein
LNGLHLGELVGAVFWQGIEGTMGALDRIEVNFWFRLYLHRAPEFARCERRFLTQLEHPVCACQKRTT